MDNDDEIMEEWDVFVTTELTPFLHLTPLPSSSLSSRFNAPSSSTSSSCRFKPHAKRLSNWSSRSTICSGEFGRRTGQRPSNGKGQKLVGAGWQWRRVQYLVGQFRSNLGTVWSLNTCTNPLLSSSRWWIALDSSWISNPFECLFNPSWWLRFPYEITILFIFNILRHRLPSFQFPRRRPFKFHCCY